MDEKSLYAHILNLSGLQGILFTLTGIAMAPS